MSRTQQRAASTAYRVLFDRVTPGTPDELANLTPAHVKRAYRKRVMQCHPDRAGVVAGSADAMAEEFSEVTNAYKTLNAFVRTPPALPTQAARNKGTADAMWRGPVPRRAMPFGEYLYYARRISWGTLQQALAWQRRDRPSFGAMARQWGLLGEEQIRRAMELKRKGERLGDVVVRMGLISPERREAIIGMQRRQQRPLGAYLVGIGALRNADLSVWLAAHGRHNSSVY